jgi:ArsR family transcriptional regulator, arsenate/arsenite/antimonite-responsive transcriptional repressor
MVIPDLKNCCGPASPGGLDEKASGELATVLAALGDPVRLRIYSLIAANEEVCSCNLEGPVGKSQPTISHHTAKLAAAGLIIGEKRGRWTWWRAVPTQALSAAAAIGSLTKTS